MINVIKQNIKETRNHHGKLQNYNATSVHYTHVKDCEFGIEWPGISHALTFFFLHMFSCGILRMRLVYS
jgi:hypothetical protein